MNRYRKTKIAKLVLFWALFFSCISTQGQQYNSDSWVSKPYGMMTVIPTIGQKSAMLMTTYSLFPKWEFTMAMWAYNYDSNISTDDGHNSSVYAKYMFYQNKAETGGCAVKFGTGLYPGAITETGVDAFKTYWVNFPATVPLFNNKLSWDIMPGVSATLKDGVDSVSSWSFTYSTRLAWYCFGPELAIVGEIFGSEGNTSNAPDYRIGLRWEPSQYVALAATYCDEIGAVEGARFEIGVMLFSPPFCGLGKNRKKQFTE